MSEGPSLFPPGLVCWKCVTNTSWSVSICVTKHTCLWLTEWKTLPLDECPSLAPTLCHSLIGWGSTTGTTTFQASVQLSAVSYDSHHGNIVSVFSSWENMSAVYVYVYVYAALGSFAKKNFGVFQNKRSMYCIIISMSWVSRADEQPGLLYWNNITGKWCITGKLHLHGPLETHAAM